MLIRAELKSQPWTILSMPFKCSFKWNGGETRKHLLLFVLPNDACSWDLCVYRTVFVKDVFRRLCDRIISLLQDLNWRLFSTLFIKLDSNIEFPWQLPTPLGRSGRIKAFFPPVAMVNYVPCSIDKGFSAPDARASLWLTLSRSRLN